MQLQPIWFRFRILVLTALLEARRYSHYPFEFIFGLLNNFASVILLGLFWYIVGQYGDGSLDSTYLLGYYFIIGGLIQFSFANLGVGSSMIKHIKFGRINADLMRPIGAFQMQYARHIGWTIPTYTASIIMIFIGVGLASSGINVTLFVLALIAMFLVNTAFNIFIAAIAFYVVEASGIKNALSHLLRFFQGFLIPISLMPELLQQILFFSPFASSLYLPTVILLGSEVPVVHVIIGIAWGIALMLLAKFVWHRSLRRYEAIGL